MENTSSFENRRVFKRVDSEVETIYKVMGDPIELGSSGYIRTKTVNISGGGVCIKVKRKIKKGHIVKVGIELSDKPISAFCEVKWCCKGEAGLKFIKLQEEDTGKILTYVRQYN